MQSSLEDQDIPETELSGLGECVGGSDDEEGDAWSIGVNVSYPIRDAAMDCLEKDPSERTDDDIEILMDFIQHFGAFADMTQTRRRALCSVMVLAVVPHEGTVVLNDGEEHDSLALILNGEVEVTRPDTSRERLQVGDSFGIRPTMQKLYHKGVMNTMTDDCQFVCIAQQDYYRIIHQGEERVVDSDDEEEYGESNEVSLLLPSDCLLALHNAQFSASDHDRDGDHMTNCADKRQGGFWYSGSSCSACNPHGVLYQPEDALRLGLDDEAFWTDILGNLALEKVSMYIIPLI